MVNMDVCVSSISKNIIGEFYIDLPLSGKLAHHLNETDHDANEMIRRLIAQMAQSQGITEQLKSDDQMAWVGAMNNIRNAAEEIILQEMIYQ